MDEATRLITVPDWPKNHPWPTPAGLRWLIFNADRNGANAWLVRVGRRVLVDEAAFFRWAKVQSEARRSEIRP